jgi:hypothetical protein
MASDFKDRHPDVDAYNAETVALARDLAEKEYLKARERRDIVERKMTTVLGFSGIIAGIISGVGFALDPNILASAAARHWYMAMYFSSITLFMCAAIVCLIGLVSRPYQHINLDTLLDHRQFAMEPLPFNVLAAETYRNMTKTDSGINRQKIITMKVSFIILGVGALSLIAQALVLLVSVE